MVKKVADLLQGGAILNKPFQPHETHIPFNLQFFIDYNLYGMNLIHLSAVKFRRSQQQADGPRGPEVKRSDDLSPTAALLNDSNKSSLHSSQNIWDAENIAEDMLLGAEVERQSTCELEVDAVAADIMNRMEVDANLGANPGLVALWEDEKQRRKEKGDTSNISPPESQERGFIPPTESDQMFRERLLDIIRRHQAIVQSQSQSSEGSQNSMEVVESSVPCSPASVVDFHLSEENSRASADTVLLGDEDADEPVVDEECIQRVVSFSQSFQGSPDEIDSQCLGGSQDQELAKILAKMADDSSPISSQVESQVYNLEDQDSILHGGPQTEEEEEEDRDGDEGEDVQKDIEDSILMSQSVWNELQEEMTQERILGDSLDEDCDMENVEKTSSDSEEDEIPQYDGPGDVSGPTKKRLGPRGPVLPCGQNKYPLTYTISASKSLEMRNSFSSGETPLPVHKCHVVLNDFRKEQYTKMKPQQKNLNLNLQAPRLANEETGLPLNITEQKSKEQGPLSSKEDTGVSVPDIKNSNTTGIKEVNAGKICQRRRSRVRPFISPKPNSPPYQSPRRIEQPPSTVHQHSPTETISQSSNGESGLYTVESFDAMRKNAESTAKFPNTKSASETDKFEVCDTKSDLKLSQRTVLQQRLHDDRGREIENGTCNAEEDSSSAVKTYFPVKKNGCNLQNKKKAVCSGELEPPKLTRMVNRKSFEDLYEEFMPNSPPDLNEDKHSATVDDKCNNKDKKLTEKMNYKRPTENFPNFTTPKKTVVTNTSSKDPIVQREENLSTFAQKSHVCFGDGSPSSNSDFNSLPLPTKSTVDLGSDNEDAPYLDSVGCDDLFHSDTAISSPMKPCSDSASVKSRSSSVSPTRLVLPKVFATYSKKEQQQEHSFLGETQDEISTDFKSSPLKITELRKKLQKLKAKTDLISPSKSDLQREDSSGECQTRTKQRSKLSLKKKLEEKRKRTSKGMGQAERLWDSSILHSKSLILNSTQKFSTVLDKPAEFSDNKEDDDNGSTTHTLQQKTGTSLKRFSDTVSHNNHKSMQNVSLGSKTGEFVHLNSFCDTSLMHNGCDNVLVPLEVVTLFDISKIGKERLKLRKMSRQDIQKRVHACDSSSETKMVHTDIHSTVKETSGSVMESKAKKLDYFNEETPVQGPDLKAKAENKDERADETESMVSETQNKNVIPSIDIIEKNINDAIDKDDANYTSSVASEESEPSNVTDIEPQEKMVEIGRVVFHDVNLSVASVTCNRMDSPRIFLSPEMDATDQPILGTETKEDQSKPPLLSDNVTLLKQTEDSLDNELFPGGVLSGDKMVEVGADNTSELGPSIILPTTDHNEVIEKPPVLQQKGNNTSLKSRTKGMLKLKKKKLEPITEAISRQNATLEETEFPIHERSSESVQHEELVESPVGTPNTQDMPSIFTNEDIPLSRKSQRKRKRKLKFGANSDFYAFGSISGSFREKTPIAAAKKLNRPTSKRPSKRTTKPAIKPAVPPIKILLVKKFKGVKELRVAVEKLHIGVSKTVNAIDFIQKTNLRDQNQEGIGKPRIIPHKNLGRIPRKYITAEKFRANSASVHGSNKKRKYHNGASGKFKDINLPSSAWDVITNQLNKRGGNAHNIELKFRNSQDGTVLPSLLPPDDTPVSKLPSYTDTTDDFQTSYDDVLYKMSYFTPKVDEEGDRSPPRPWSPCSLPEETDDIRDKSKINTQQTIERDGHISAIKLKDSITCDNNFESCTVSTLSAESLSKTIVSPRKPREILKSRSSIDATVDSPLRYEGSLPICKSPEHWLSAPSSLSPNSSESSELPCGQRSRHSTHSSIGDVIDSSIPYLVPQTDESLVSFSDEPDGTSQHSAEYERSRMSPPTLSPSQPDPNADDSQQSVDNEDGPPELMPSVSYPETPNEKVKNHQRLFTTDSQVVLESSCESSTFGALDKGNKLPGSEESRHSLNSETSESLLDGPCSPRSSVTHGSPFCEESNDSFLSSHASEGSSNRCSAPVLVRSLSPCSSKSKCSEKDLHSNSQTSATSESPQVKLTAVNKKTQSSKKNLFHSTEHIPTEIEKVSNNSNRRSEPGKNVSETDVKSLDGRAEFFTRDTVQSKPMDLSMGKSESRKEPGFDTSSLISDKDAFLEETETVNHTPFKQNTTTQVDQTAKLPAQDQDEFTESRQLPHELPQSYSTPVLPKSSLISTSPVNGSVSPSSPRGRPRLKNLNSIVNRLKAKQLNFDGEDEGGIAKEHVGKTDVLGNGCDKDPNVHLPEGDMPAKVVTSPDLYGDSFDSPSDLPEHKDNDDLSNQGNSVVMGEMCQEVQTKDRDTPADNLEVLAAPKSTDAACTSEGLKFNPTCQRSATVLTPVKLPPSRDEVIKSLVSFDLGEEQVVDPHCSVPQDMPEKPKELGGRVLKLQSPLVADLPDYRTELPITMIQGWQFRMASKFSGQEFLSQGDDFSLIDEIKKNPELKKSLHGNTKVVMTPCRPPPNVRSVRRWLYGQDVKEEKIPKSTDPCESTKVETSLSDKKSESCEVAIDEKGPDVTPKTSKPDFVKIVYLKRTLSDSKDVESVSYEKEISNPPARLKSPTRWDQSPPLSACTATPSVSRKRKLSDDVTPSTSTPSIPQSRKRKVSEDSNSSLQHSTPVKKASFIDIEVPSCTPIVGENKMRTGNDDSPSTSAATPARKLSRIRRLSTGTENLLRKTLLSSQMKNAAGTPLNQRIVSQIEGPSPNNTYGFKVSLQNLQDAKAVHEVQHLTVMSMELFIWTRGDLRPDPEFDAIGSVFYHILNDTTETEKRTSTGVIIVDPVSANLEQDEGRRLSTDAADSSTGKLSHREKTLLQKSGVSLMETSYVKDERELFVKFLELVRKWDPDILVGFEIQMLSWGYLLQRAAYLEVNLCSLISRIPGEDKRSSFSAEKDEWGADYNSEIHIAGRIVLNLWRILRHEVTLNIYSFENIAFHVLHRRIPCFSFKQLTSWYGHRTDLYRWRTIAHYVTRTKGNIEIMQQLDLIEKTSEFGRVFGIEFYHVLSRGSQYRVESMMLRLAKPMNYVAVSPSVQQRAKMKAPECIPLTLEPESRFYSHPVVVLDFQSLYPSIMIAYNYCYSTCMGRVDKLVDAHEGEFQFGCTTLRVTPSTLKKMKNSVSVSPSGVAFVQSDVRKGIISSMVEEILNTRLMVKKAMKKHKGDKALERLLNARQLGLKLIANVTFGYTSANFSGRMPCVEIGDSIVSKARETLERAIQMVEETEKWGAKVVYGDTDSLFILLKGRTKEQAFKIGQDIADAVTAANPKPIKLKFEKVYLPCVLQTKKRYVGFMYETVDQKEPVFDAKGIETVRRDSCSAVSKILERSIKILFTTRDVSQVKQYVQKQCVKVMEGKASMQDLIFAKEYRGKAGYKPMACVPALELSKKMLAADRRSEPRVGERVPYVIVYGSPGLPLIQLVRSPVEVLQDSSLRLNAVYYITKQILPPLARLFSLIGVDVFSWYQDLPRVIRAAPAMDIASDTKKGTISQYFNNINCPVCGELTKQGVCGQCQTDPQTAVTVLNSRILKWERTQQQLLKICGSCMGTMDSNMPCTSLDCPILYRLDRATKEVQQAPRLRQVIEDMF
ncbi:uncharacterized protein LOC106167234 [Lingula anatina]|uniref:DNA polymerase zeta catalytic subunit n=1 Tax=Lingula anatina TaxID=7574 RepID=A0A1S3ITJ8_LINAN|nr:uncharacterized protein LOC106167234 [Lingula anatina]|eukprot:XP_013401408.1 uncharacterized protein LOC106167234 [Lingula anatina]